MYNKEIKKDRKIPSDDQIQSHKDFGRVLQQVKPKAWYQNKWFWGGTTIASIVFIGVLWLLNNPPQDDQTTLTNRNDHKTDTASSTVKPDFIVPFEGGVYQTKSQTQIKVPESAFVKDGSVYEGQAYIKFQEYFDYADILHHDIDMDYDSAGVAYRLETGGMFDLYAFDSVGNALEIKSGKEIVVEMASPNHDRNYSFYHYDFENEQWNYEGSANHFVAQNKVVNVDEGNDITDHTKLPQLKSEKAKCEKRIVSLQEKKPTQPITKSQTPYQFTLDIDESEFPELASFDGFELGLHPDETYEKVELLKKSWSDMELKTIEKGLLYQLQLKDHNRSAVMKVVPLGKSDLWEEKMKIYNNWESDLSQEENRLKEINAAIESASEEISQTEEIEEKRRIALLNKSTEPKEVKDLSSWVKIKTDIDMLEQKTALKGNEETNAFNQFKRQYFVTKTGRHNCDRPIKYPDEKKVQGVFALAHSKVEFDRIILIDEKKNTTFPYTANEFYKFAYNPRHKNAIIAFDSVGQSYLFKPKAFEAIDKNMDQYLFTLQPCQKDVSSSEKMRLFLSELWLSS